ncbi:MAG: hypothetical protein KZQ95_02780 [Candidatus Thiodiazotropha sp. (ex Epidulcina cf. delphinae)]|nr:hypothetical protein [Candidatus Thiodiazotropha sp. (ex Epidulcina cf. delphinae)]MCU7928582.1 hypothetical protein [Candidatus Thiodiazotropha sp. (ex Dulcina madagascariensis)]
MALKDLTESWATLLSIFTASAIVLSVTYDFGYLLFVGVSLSEVPTTLADHVRSSLVWLPYLLIAMFIVFIYELINTRIEGGLTEEEIVQSSPFPRFTYWFRRSPLYLWAALALLPSTLFLFKDIVVPLKYWAISTPCVWLILHSWFFGHARIQKRTTEEFYTLSKWVPGVMMIVFFFGAISAESSVKNERQHTFELQNETVSGVLLRSYDKYFLLWKKDEDSYIFLPSSLVRRFYLERKNESNREGRVSNQVNQGKPGHPIFTF